MALFRDTSSSVRLADGDPARYVAKNGQITCKESATYRANLQDTAWSNAAAESNSRPAATTAAPEILCIRLDGP